MCVCTVYITHRMSFNLYLFLYLSMVLIEFTVEHRLTCFVFLFYSFLFFAGHETEMNNRCNPTTDRSWFEWVIFGCVSFIHWTYQAHFMPIYAFIEYITILRELKLFRLYIHFQWYPRKKEKNRNYVYQNCKHVNKTNNTLLSFSFLFVFFCFSSSSSYFFRVDSILKLLFKWLFLSFIGTLLLGIFLDLYSFLLLTTKFFWRIRSTIEINWRKKDKKIEINRRFPSLCKKLKFVTSITFSGR